LSWILVYGLITLNEWTIGLSDVKVAKLLFRHLSVNGDRTKLLYSFK